MRVFLLKWRVTIPKLPQVAGICEIKIDGLMPFICFLLGLQPSSYDVSRLFWYKPIITMIGTFRRDSEQVI